MYKRFPGMHCGILWKRNTESNRSCCDTGSRYREIDIRIQPSKRKDRNSQIGSPPVECDSDPGTTPWLEEVEKAISRMNPGKAAGPDEKPAEQLKLGER